MPDIAQLPTLVQYGGIGLGAIAIVALVLVVYDNRKERRDMAKEMRAMADDNARTLVDVLDRNTVALTRSAEATAALKESLPHVCHFQR